MDIGVVCTTVLLSQSDSFPFKCDLLAMKSDHLMLIIILMAVSILVTKVTGFIVPIIKTASERLLFSDSEIAEWLALVSDFPGLLI